ncbi:hypothetical protein GLAREA_02467 [Glarea lozoyensis ATCC 20868]|uniref:Uncharacterized protein n=1 Tax=Glarea lozoyensis (strain ATCC 20868 / MF5171) TaxID=1116229 RepID=S3CMW4_GLAL2|nr:uncharacterized protein GLAREA_02467 [Glarea lozoyensis ATCC 20868]EPE26554.1 hypothetical protein GLAREA_02467 [Glarea lozoyensis ATCC 20868]
MHTTTLFLPLLPLLSLFFFFSHLPLTTALTSQNPSSPHRQILKRQAGYGPEYGECAFGTNCADACGKGWIGCPASTQLTLFCYDPGAGQVCCEDGNGSEFVFFGFGGGKRGDEGMGDEDEEMGMGG